MSGKASWTPGQSSVKRLLALCACALAFGASTAFAQRSPTPDEGIAWSALRPAQKQALRPLEGRWSTIDATRRDKWVVIADKFPSLSAAEQARIQTRMAEWAKLSPNERGQARLNYKEAQQVSPEERKARWEAYKALPPEQRKQLAARAAPAARKGTGSAAHPSPPEGKSNLVPNSSYAPRPKPVAPTVAQAEPGATTNIITQRPTPPPHQQTGLPKIAASPGFVDQSTLLPKRGPQGAAPSRARPNSGPVPARP